MNPETINIPDFESIPMDFDPSTMATGLYQADAAQTAALTAMLAGASLFMFVFGIAVYIYMALCLYKIAKKLKEENAWFAWLPILNILLMLQIAKKPMWWILLMFIPLVNFVVGILLMIEFFKRLGKPAWWVLLLFVPVVNFVVWGILAFGGKKK